MNPKKNPAVARMLLVSIAVASVLSGCAGTRQKEAHRYVTQKTNNAVSEIINYNTPKGIRTSVVDQQYIAADYERYVPKSEGIINMTVGNGMTVTSAFQTVAAQGNYSMIIANDIDPGVLREPITLDLRNQSVEGALREVANAAGLVAIVDPQSKKATLANYATYTYRIPSSVFRTQSSTSSMTASPSSSSSSGGSGSSGSSSSSDGGGMSASFSVTETLNSNVATIKEAIVRVAGEGSMVDIDPDSGLVSVRGRASQLARVGRFLNDLARDVMMQVEIQTSIVRVDIRDSQEYGVDLSKVVNSAGNPWQFATTAANGIANAVATGSYTRGSGLSASLKALAEIGKVTVLDQSTVVHKNHQASVFFNGRTSPYVPKLETTVNNNSSSTSAEVEHATDGISIGVVPHILNSQYVDLHLQPMLNQLGSLQTFQFGQNQASAYQTRSTNLNLKLVVENGKTTIASQIITDRGEQTKVGLPLFNRTALNALAGTDKDGFAQSRILLLVHPRIIEAPKVNTLVGESL